MRQPRLTYPGAFHHAMNRGVNGEAIFTGVKHKRVFINLLAEKVFKFRMRLFAYCLMDNHYHLVLQNTSGRMSDFFRNLNTHYAFYFRKVMGGKGYVFQGRFKSTIIEDESYLSQVILYVLQNPRRTRITLKDASYRWSSEDLYFSEKGSVDWLDSAFVEGLFGSRGSLVSGVKGELIEKLPLRPSQFGGVIGSDHFLEKALDRFDRRKPSQSDKRRRNPDDGFDPVEKVLMEFERAHGISVEKINGCTITGKRLRGELLVRLRDLAGLTLREIIEYPQFADVKYHSLPNLYQIARKRFYATD